MFEGIKNGGALFGAVLEVATKHPVLIIPLLLVWSVYAPLVIYLYFYFDWGNASTFSAIGAGFGSIFAISVLLSWSCFILLEQIRLIETGQKAKLLLPVVVATKNVGRALPITLAWASMWFLITVAEMMIRPKDSGNDQQATPEGIARTLGGDGAFSISGAFFDALKKGVRMIAFLIFPAIAWEQEKRPIRRGLGVARSHKTEFASGFVLTEIAAAIVFIPPAIVFAIADNTDVVVSDDVWVTVIVYCGFAWSFSLLLEQIFTAELYLWDMKWREACAAAKKIGQPLPKLGDVPRPSILDDRAELLPSSSD